MHLSASLLLSTLALTASVDARPRASHHWVRRELDVYEEQFTNSQAYTHDNSSIKLIGYQKVKIPDDQLAHFEDHYFTHMNEIKARAAPHFYDEANKEVRVYFPVADALLEHEGDLTEANHLGELAHRSLDGDYAVLGRRQTATVRGVASNKIHEGTIYLGERNLPVRSIGDNVRVYDFGYRDMEHSHHHHHDKREEEENGDSSEDQTNNGCVANHGGINCSKAYGIDEGRCTMNPDTCMDYNGYFSSCEKDDKYLYFIGSDCYVSVSQGNCWNEMVAAE